MKLTNNGTIKNNGKIVNHGTIDGAGKVLNKSEVAVTFGATPIRYGETVTITATAKAAATVSRAAAQNTVDFWVGGIGTGTKLNGSSINATPSGGTFTASLEVPLTGAKWQPGTYTIWADFGETDSLQANTGSAVLTVGKAEVTVKAVDRNIEIGGVIPDLANPKQDVDYTVTGLLGSDALTALPTLKYNKTPDNSKTGSYDIIVFNANAGGIYEVRHENGKLTVSNHPLTGKLTISGTAKVGSTLTARLTGSNNTGELSYVWRQDQQERGTGQTYKLASDDAGHSLTVEVTSSVETGKLSAQTKVIAKPSSGGSSGGGGGSGGSGSGGSSSGSGSKITTKPSTPSNPANPATPANPAVGEITAGQPDEKGAVSVSGGQIARALQTAQAANRQQNGKNGVAVQVNLQKGVMTATLDRAGLDNLIAAGGRDERQGRPFRAQRRRHPWRSGRHTAPLRDSRDKPRRPGLDAGRGG